MTDDKKPEENGTESNKQEDAEASPKKKRKISVFLKIMTVLSVAYLVYFFKEWAFRGDKSLGIVGIVAVPPFILSLSFVFRFGYLLLLNSKIQFLEKLSNHKHFFRIYVCIWLAVLFGDHIVGYVYYKNLCITKAGGHIYKTVDLPEMPVWDRKFAPKSDSKYGLDYRWDTYKIIPSIKTTHITLHQENEMLSEMHEYKFLGGWFLYALRLGTNKSLGGCGKWLSSYEALTINGMTYGEVYKIQKEGKKK